jgi:hypothetical protein
MFSYLVFPFFKSSVLLDANVFFFLGVQISWKIKWWLRNL